MKSICNIRVSRSLKPKYAIRAIGGVKPMTQLASHFQYETHPEIASQYMVEPIVKCEPLQLETHQLLRATRDLKPTCAMRVRNRMKPRSKVRATFHMKPKDELRAN